MQVSIDGDEDGDEDGWFCDEDGGKLVCAVDFFK